jgi:hypothetical protein
MLTQHQRDQIAVGWIDGADADKITQVTGIAYDLVREELTALEQEFDSFVADNELH